MDGIRCECGMSMPTHNYKRHQRSKKHIDIMNNQVNQINIYKCECGMVLTNALPRDINRHKQTNKHNKAILIYNELRRGEPTSDTDY